jgi:hypothetical protein
MSQNLNGDPATVALDGPLFAADVFPGHAAAQVQGLPQRVGAGASVSFDRDLKGEERELLREIVYASDDKYITLRTDHHTCKLDVRKVDPSELSAVCGVFQKMNFDSRIQLSGV